MKCRVEALGDRAVMVLEGEITIQSITALKSAFCTSIADSASVIVDVDGVTGSDLSFLQLLCAAHRHAVAVGKPLGFRGRRNDRFQSLAVEAGYARRHSCLLDATGTCLWALGDMA